MSGTFRCPECLMTVRGGAYCGHCGAKLVPLSEFAKPPHLRAERGTSVIIAIVLAIFLFSMIVLARP